MATATATVRVASPRRRSSAQRAIWRAAIAAAALASAAYVAGAGAFAARADIDAARSLLAQGTDAANPEVQALVRSALRRDPTLPAAVELTALALEAGGDRPGAARLYRLSDRISRRSLATRLWLAQDAVERGDVAGALAQMEIALRTSSAAPKLVFPALARGLEDPELVARIAALADRPSDWREAFLIHVADNAAPQSAAALFQAMRDRRLILKDELDRKLISRLVDTDEFSLARQVDRTFASRGGTDPLVADGRFDTPAARYPFGWGMTDRREVGAARQVESGRPVLAYHANPAESGQVAAQLLTLPRGQYRLETRSESSEGPDPPLWVISCASGPPVIATLAVGSGRAARSRAVFEVPADCPAQWLALSLRPALDPQSGRVQMVAISEMTTRMSARR